MPPPGVCAGGWARVHLSGINAPFVVLRGCAFSTLACVHFCGAAARLVTVGGADSSDHRLLVARSSTFSSKQPHTQINSRHMLRLYKKQKSTEVKKTTRNQIWHHQFKETVCYIRWGAVFWVKKCTFFFGCDLTGISTFLAISFLLCFLPGYDFSFSGV